MATDSGAQVEHSVIKKSHVLSRWRIR
jgi:hypothetical protein